MKTHLNTVLKKVNQLSKTKEVADATQVQEILIKNLRNIAVNVQNMYLLTC